MAGQPGKRLAASIEADIRKESWLHGKFKLRAWVVGANGPLVVEDLREGPPREIGSKDDWLRIKQQERRAAQAARQAQTEQPAGAS